MEFTKILMPLITIVYILPAILSYLVLDDMLSYERSRKTRARLLLAGTMFWPIIAVLAVAIPFINLIKECIWEDTHE